MKSSKEDKIVKIHPKNKLNDLTSKEWIPETISVWNQKGLGKNHPDAQIERQHPAPFSFTDISRLIQFFTKKNQTVLDPFSGIGSTLKACAILQRKGIGIELNPRFSDLARERLRIEDLQGVDATPDLQEVITGDSWVVMNEMEDESIDFIVTSPPYWSILKKEDHKAKQERIEQGLDIDYGTDPSDLGNIEKYDDFLEELTGYIDECRRLLREEKYMAIVVSDFRHKSKYIMFHADLARACEDIGMEMRGLKILYQRQKKIYPYGYPYSYVPNIHHQFILILQKPKS